MVKQGFISVLKSLNEKILKIKSMKQMGAYGPHPRDYYDNKVNTNHSEPFFDQIFKIISSKINGLEELTQIKLSQLSQKYKTN